MENYNSTIRKKLSKIADKYAMYGIDAKTSMYMYANALENAADFYQNIVVIYLTSLGFIDAYRIYSYKAKECTCNDEELEFYIQLENIEDYNDLITEAYTDPSFLQRLVYSSYQFNEMDALGKINLTKSLSSEEKAWLEEMIPFITQDYATYDREITIEDIIMNIKKKENYQQKNDGIINRDKITIGILGFIRNLIKVDPYNGNKLLLEVAKVDYEASKFMMDKSEDDCFIDHVDLYENYNVDDILDRLTIDQTFLYDALESVISVCVDHVHCNMKVNREELQTDEVKEVEKKLTLK